MSDGPREPSKYGAEMAEDVVRLLEHLKIKKAHLIGYSMGAFIAGKVAASHPERVISIVYGGQSPLIVGTPPSPGPNECEIFAKAVDEGKGLGPYLMAVWPADKPKITLDQANAITKMMYGAKDVKAMALAGLSLDALEVKAGDLAKCKAPCLFIYGSKEPDRLKQRVESLRKALGQGEIVEVKDADHGTTLVRPEFAAALGAFLVAHKTK
jgi:pimeloyl-ACP methyl ester carboxylesterase